MSTDLAVIEAALKAATPGPWRADNNDVWTADGDRFISAPVRIADANLIANAPTWLAELVERVKVAEAAVVSAKADGWDERDRARASYLGPDHGHYEDCMGWEDCHCATYPNPYRALDGDA